MNKKPDFKKVKLSTKNQNDQVDWKKKAEEEISSSIDHLLFETNEGIKIKALYTEEDLFNMPTFK